MANICLLDNKSTIIRIEIIDKQIYILANSMQNVMGLFLLSKNLVLFKWSSTMNTMRDFDVVS